MSEETEVTTETHAAEPLPSLAPKPEAAPAPKAAPKTLASDGGTPDEEIRRTVQSTWPDNWRELMAGEDPDAVKRLKNFKGPDGVFKSWRNAEKKISSGQLLEPRPDTQDEEILGKWREKNGVPAAPREYYNALPGGLQFADEDRPALDSIFDTMHKQDLPAAKAAEVVKTYFSLREANLQAQMEQDAATKRATEDALRNEWGGDYRANMNALAMFFSDVGNTELEGKLLNARMPDGSMLGNDPDVLKFLVDIARDRFPDGEVIMPGANPAGALQSIEQEIAQLQMEMSQRDVPGTYWNDPRKQARYTQLLEMKERQTQRQKRL